VTNRLSRTIHVGRGADRIAVAGGSVWVTNAIDETVSRVDPATGRVMATVPVGARPVGIAAGDGKIWVIVAR
jgi:YVTN family beta-propeller protein